MDALKRTVLFRGKQVDNGEWIEGYYVPCTFGNWPCRPAIVNKADIESGWWHYDEVDPSTVCQYTGLTDKNGVKIFEGDIVKASCDGELQCRAPVVWGHGSFETDGMCMCLAWADNLELEIIGNVFDNPELLEENNT